MKILWQKIKKPDGQNLLEVLVALAIFLYFLSGAAILAFRHLNTINKANDLSDVGSIGEESLEAIQSIAYNNWPALADGSYGLTSAGGSWQLQVSPDSVNGKYSRTVIISPVKRDIDCNIVLSGGTSDPDTKLVTININWPDFNTSRTRSFTQYFTRWDAPTYCVVKGQAGYLLIDVSRASIDSTKKVMVGVAFTNISEVPITIDKLKLTWTMPGDIEWIKIEGTNYWHSTNGTGTPQGTQPSGTELDIVNVVIPAGETYDADGFRFKQKIDGSTVTIKATMTDGTSTLEVTTLPFNP